MSHAPNDYALVIGINHYPDWANGEKSLTGSVNDANNFHGWLISSNGGGLNPAHARLIVSTKNPVAPLQDSIDREFKIIRTLSEENGTRRRFYFYFSGHGHSPAMSEGRQSLCLANWSVQDQGAALQLESYLNTAVGCLQFEESLFFLDCCRVREATPLGKSSDLECGDPKFANKHYIIFYGTEHYQAGYEQDSVNPNDARGFFTEALINILRAGRIEAAELQKRLREEVPTLALPRKQVARALQYANKNIYLGPPTGPVPAGVAPPGTFVDRAQLRVSLDTNLSTDISAGESVRPPAPGEITVMRGDDIVGSARGEFRQPLEVGRYHIRISHGEALDIHSVDLKADMSIRFTLPRRHSAAPLSSTIDKHEYITNPVVDASRASRVKGRKPRESVFIALRTRGDLYQGEIPGSLTVTRREWPYETRGEPPLATVETALTLIPAQPGAYELNYKDRQGSTLLLSIPVAEGWDTQIFVVGDGERLVLERASVFMQTAGHGFNPADSLTDAYELSLADLVTGGPGPDRVTMGRLLEGKFRNPLFGLVGAHFLLRELRLARRREEHRHNLLDVVIHNMGRLLGEHNPDVMALKFGRAQLRGDSSLSGDGHIDSVEFPPLLRASFLAFVEASIDYQTNPLWVDDIAMGGLTNSPWACWDESKTFLWPPQIVDAMRAEIERVHRTNEPIDYKRLARRLEMPYRMLQGTESIARDEQERA